MSTAQIIYEQYKVLPVDVKNELVELINEDNGEMVDISLSALRDSIKQVNLLKQGKAKTRPASELLRELQNG